MPLVEYYVWVETSKSKIKQYYLMLVMKRAQQSLNDLLENDKFKLTPEMQNLIASQLFLAVLNCNKNDIYHRDIKAANILINLN